MLRRVEPWTYFKFLGSISQTTVLELGLFILIAMFILYAESRHGNEKQNICLFVCLFLVCFSFFVLLSNEKFKTVVCSGQHALDNRVEMVKVDKSLLQFVAK